MNNIIKNIGAYTVLFISFNYLMWLDIGLDLRGILFTVFSNPVQIAFNIILFLLFTIGTYYSVKRNNRFVINCVIPFVLCFITYHLVLNMIYSPEKRKDWLLIGTVLFLPAAVIALIRVEVLAVITAKKL